MSKKIAGLMLLICAGIIAVFIYTYKDLDEDGPEIQFSDNEFVYQTGMSDEELIKDVTAYDEVDGDVSDEIAIEAVYQTSDHDAIIIYVAKDSRNNITKKKRIVKSVSGGQSLKDTEKKENDETDKEGTDAEDETEIQLSEEDKIKSEQEKAAEEMPADCPRIYLSAYLVRLPVGSEVEKISYVKDITDDVDDANYLWRKIVIDGDVDTGNKGTYECTYFVTDSQENESNHAVLTFIVE
ncbi:immunoglobulin-like domain-containing protein [Anaerostipes sp.]|uniref:immunoglobulin-like domain-containing protein n=1 Tax=Anaerostipes sp. TaxID=1872530 RepID=UPI00258E7CBF|nr:immunoglobulin-like domain-containing protein [Anaerostipes sp.]MCI5623937.1 DUF5011 domain-containing protein [Anaerostipes sp.]